MIVSSNVLEHIACVPAFMRAAWRLLKRDGRLLIVVPPIIGPKPRAADLANPYHLNSWSPHQWHFVLRQFWTEVRCYSHTLDRAGVTLDFANGPRAVVISEADFSFNPVELEQLYRVPTLSAVFLAQHPRPARALPRKGAPVVLIDNSVTRESPLRRDVVPAGRWRRVRTGSAKVFRTLMAH